MLFLVWILKLILHFKSFGDLANWVVKWILLEEEKEGGRKRIYLELAEQMELEEIQEEYASQEQASLASLQQHQEEQLLALLLLLVAGHHLWLSSFLVHHLEQKQQQWQIQ